MRRHLITAVLAAVLATGSPAVASSVELRHDPRTVTTTSLAPPDAPERTVEACATTNAGRRIACLTATAGTGGVSKGVLCTYDDLLGVFGWGLNKELVCVETTNEWGYVAAPGVCEYTFGSDRPHACVNGRDHCLLWVAGVRIVCRR